jgi:hypothetical protein
MNAKISHPVERDAQWVQAYRDELVGRITQAVREDGTVEPLQGVRLHRSSLPNEPLHSVAEPHFAVIAQGSRKFLWATSAIGSIPIITVWVQSGCLSPVESLKPRKKDRT